MSMEKENKVDSTETIPVQAKEGVISAASALRKTGIIQGKDCEKSSSSSTETIDNSSVSSWDESCTGTNLTESERQDTNSNNPGSRKAENRKNSFIVEPTSIQGSDRTSTVTEDEEESRRKISKSLNSSKDKPVEIDSGQTKESMVNGKQDLKETAENGNGCLTTLDKNKRDKTKDCDEQQENLAVKDSCSEKDNNDKTGDTGNQDSAKEVDSNDDGLESRPRKRRKCAAKVTGDKSSCTGDVNAEWNLDEKRRLLDALDYDAGRRHWNTIANHVKTKNVQQIKHFTEKLRAEASGVTPVHSLGEKNNPLQSWINVCERLRGGTEDIDAKCIPQVMTIAAVEPTSSSPDVNGPNYSRIYTFLSSILRGQTTLELTPIDARVVLELIQTLEMKLMNADLDEQQGFLRSRYSGITKDLEKEQIILAMDELQKKSMNDGNKETRDMDARRSNSFEGSGSSSPQSCETTKKLADTENNQGSKSSDTFITSSSNTAGNSSLEIITDEDDLSMDIQTGKRSETFEPLPFTVTIPNLEQIKISNLDEIKTEKAETAMDFQTDKRPKISDDLPSDTATITDSEEAKICNLDEIRTDKANKERAPDVQTRRLEMHEPKATAAADSQEAEISTSNEIRTEEAVKDRTSMDSQTVRPEASESLPSENATVSDTKETNTDKTDTQTEKKLESSWWTLTVVVPNSENTKTDKPNAPNCQPSPTNSKTGETPESTDSMTCLQNTASPGSTRTSSKQKTLSPPDKSIRSKTETRKSKIERLKKGLKKPKLSSLNPVCVPVTMLNIKPKAHQSL